MLGGGFFLQKTNEHRSGMSTRKKKQMMDVNESQRRQNEDVTRVPPWRRWSWLLLVFVMLMLREQRTTKG